MDTQRYNKISERVNEILDNVLNFSEADILLSRLEHIGRVLKGKVKTSDPYSLVDVKPIITGEKEYCGLVFVVLDRDYNKKVHKLVLLRTNRSFNKITLDHKEFSKIGINCSGELYSELSSFFPHTEIEIINSEDEDTSILNKEESEQQQPQQCIKEYYDYKDLFKVVDRELAANLIIGGIIKDLTALTFKKGSTIKSWSPNIDKDNLAFVLRTADKEYTFNLLDSDALKDSIMLSTATIPELSFETLTNIATYLSRIFPTIKFEAVTDSKECGGIDIELDKARIIYSGKQDLCDSAIVNIETVANIFVRELNIYLTNKNQIERCISTYSISSELASEGEGLTLNIIGKDSNYINALIPLVINGNFVKCVDVESLKSTLGIKDDSLCYVLSEIFTGIRFKYRQCRLKREVEEITL